MSVTLPPSSPLLLPAPTLPGVERVVAEPLRFKAKLAIGEDAYASLRMVNRAREWWDVLGAAGAGAAVAKSGLVASTFFVGTAATPIGWVAFAALASGGACYGMYRLLSNTKGERVIEIPKYLNTPLDTLGLAIFDLIAPLSLRLAAVDGVIEPAERQYLIDHLVHEWGMSRDFVEQAVAVIEPRLTDGSLDVMAAEGAEFLHLNPDCNHQAIVKDLSAYLRAMLEAGGPLTQAEEDALWAAMQALSTTPPNEMAKAWTKAMAHAGGAAGQVRTALTGAAGWTQDRLPSIDQVRTQTADAAAQALEAARKSAQWTQERLPSAEVVKTQATDTAAQALDAARKAAVWTQERLPSAEQLKSKTSEAAAEAAVAATQALGAARKGLSWAREQAARAAGSAGADKLLKRGKDQGKS